MGMDKKREPFFYIFLVVALEKSQWGSNQPRLWQREANNVHAHAAPTNDFKLVWHESSMSRGCLLNIGMTWARQLLLSIRRCCCINDKRRSIPVCCLVIASPLSLSLSYAHFLCPSQSVSLNTLKSKESNGDKRREKRLFGFYYDYRMLATTWHTQRDSETARVKEQDASSTPTPGGFIFSWILSFFWATAVATVKEKEGKGEREREREDNKRKGGGMAGWRP